MKEKEFRILNPRLDANFKALFTQDTEDSKKALKSFLTAAIGKTVKEVNVIENEKSKEFDLQRGIDYDINCSFDDGSLAQIEMQGCNTEYEYGYRVEYYLARLLSSSVKIGEDWSKVPEAYQISVLNFIYDDSNENAIHRYVMCDRKDGSELKGRLNVIFMELPKLPEIKDLAEVKNLSAAVKWCKFIQSADDPRLQNIISELAKEEEGIMSAESTLKGISMDQWRWIIQGKIEGKERDELSVRNYYARKDSYYLQKDEEFKEKEEKLSAQEEKLSAQEEKLSAQEEKLSAQEEKLSAQEEKLSAQEEKLSAQEEELIAQKRNIVLNLLEAGVFSDEKIAEMTGLSVEEVGKIQASK
ncbi:MAG: Rpn family recombination-promoting nuclease/putative transposase [Treponema sp.]|nr:Rpn family recombination-promoting nuclease/putative transposase [Treponema sp.]